MKKFTRKHGDRYDGYRVKSKDPFFYIVPHIMPERVDSQVFYPDTVDITEIEKFVREHNQTDIPGLRTFHVFLAAAVRTAAEKPYMNRFVVGRKMYHARNFVVSMTIKKLGTKEEAIIKLPFDYTDSIYDVAEKLSKAVKENKVAEESNGTDKVAGILGHLPVGILGFVVGCLKALDKKGWMPKAINKISPFHTSLFITNVGSIGIGPVFHHIYNFGTTSVFIAIGKKYYANEIDDEGNVSRRHKMDIKFVVDERTCDGAYYSSIFRKFGFYIKNPDLLLKKGEKVVIDDGIDMKGRKEYEEEITSEINY